VKTKEELQKIASQVRRDIVKMVHGAKSGHPGGSLGCADLLTYLYFHKLKHIPAPFNMDALEEDVFILSNGHISPVLYSVLSRSGYFPPDEMKTFRKINSRLQGHPATAEKLPGVRVATGSLGQGLSVAIGAALTKKLNNEDRLVFSLHGDGEMQEGQNWEAFMFGAHHKVDNIISFIDYNGQQIDGPTDEVMSLGNLYNKVESFGWHVLSMDGNNYDDIFEKVDEAIAATGKGKPVAVIMKTVMGKGVDFMENDHKWHGIPPSDEQLNEALEQLPETLGDF
jgi:transketolase